LNIEDYISSGILESYVVGGLSDQERKEVEKNLSLYPRLREELLKIEEAQEELLMQAAIQPKAGVKKKLMEKVSGGNAGAKVVPLRAVNRWPYLAAASLALAMVTSYLAYNYWNKWRDVKADLDGLITQNQQLAQDYERVNKRIHKIEDDIKVIDNPAFKRITLKGTDSAPSSLAYVYWNETTTEVFLSIQNMKALSQENQYQLWAIVDGKPVDAGTFDYDPSGLLKMKGMSKASAFAVTIEPRGGNASPTLETMQVLGSV
jgi:anti-sigma-K factor RskA